MKTRIKLVAMLALAFILPVATMIVAQQAGAGPAAPARPEGPCDVYAAGGTPCVAAHSSTRAMYAAYNGPLYQVMRQSDGKTQDIGPVQPTAGDGGGYADAAAQDAFCANTTCWITTLYDQSGHHNDLTQAPRGGTGNPTVMGGFNSLPLADMAPITILGHKAYGVFIEPGMGLRNNNPHGTAVDDQAEGQYWVINGHHYNGGCCYDYGNAEIDSRDDGDGTMETTYFGNTTGWYHGPAPGPWIMTDQENNLVGCVTDSPNNKNCNLPIITWRFVTAMAKGEPHHWTSMGGDSQKGALQVMFDGPRVQNPNNSYDPMRKQGAILLGNGGDNSNASQGTFYEGAMTVAGTFPTDATDQKVQANVVAAGYGVQRVSVTPANAAATPPGLQTFAPGSSQETMVTFNNTTGAPATGVTLSIAAPAGWTSVVSGSTDTTRKFADPVAPGASVSATFKVTSGPAAFNGDLIGNAAFTNASGQTQTDKMAERVRNISPIKINEFANSFIELYNAGTSEVDLSNWSLTEHPIREAIFSSVKIPAGTKLAPHGFYVLGLSGSGLALPAKKGDTVIHVRSVAGLNVGDTIEIDTGAGVETRKIASLGSATGNSTTLWQPLPEGPVITIPAGSTSVPVATVGGFAVGDKIGLGYGATYPVVNKDVEKYEVVTVTAVGKAGAQSVLTAAAKAGDTTIRVRAAGSISVGDKITLDIDSVGHGVEVVTVKSIAGVGAAPATVPARGAALPMFDDGLNFVAAPGAGAVPPGTGPAGTGPGAGRGGRGRGGPGGPGGTAIELTAPLKFNHSSNLPFNAWGTGISFQPATAYAHSSNEPVLALGTGITLDKALESDHGIHAVVNGASAPGAAKPNQWFGGPVIGNSGNIVLRDAGGLVADSLNFGAIVDPWAGEGYQGRSPGNGCSVPSPNGGGGGRGGRGGVPPATGAGGVRSAARVADGVDTDSNCADFRVQAASPGATNQAAQ